MRKRQAIREAQLAEAEASMLEGRQALAELFLQKEQHAGVQAQQEEADELLRRERAEISGIIKDERQQLGEIQRPP